MSVVPPVVSLNASEPTRKFVAKRHDAKLIPLRAKQDKQRIATAIVYCEANFGALDGKTANGLIRRSEKHEFLSVIDSEQAGLDTGTDLDDKPNGIPICRDLADALEHAGAVPEFHIFGMAPASGMLSNHERALVLEAMRYGMNIVYGLYAFPNEDPVFAAACIASKVEILDVRRPRDKKILRMFSGRIHEVTCPVIAVPGTDCAIGRRTTANIMASAVNRSCVKTVMIGTGQTGLIQGGATVSRSTRRHHNSALASWKQPSLKRSKTKVPTSSLSKARSR